jgi:hypothetical protein
MTKGAEQSCSGSAWQHFMRTYQGTRPPAPGSLVPDGEGRATTMALNLQNEICGRWRRSVVVHERRVRPGGIPNFEQVKKENERSILGR